MLYESAGARPALAFVYSLCLAAALTGCAAKKETATQEAPSNPENQELALQYFLAGSLLDQKGEYAKAILEYQEALKYKQDPAIHNALARDYTMLGKHETAIAAGKEAVRLAPADKKYRQSLAEVYMAAGNLNGAIGEFEALIGIDSTDKTARMSLAQLYQVREPARAAAQYEYIIERFGPDAAALMQLVQIYTVAEEYPKAVGALNQLIELEPDNLEIKQALGEVYLRQDSVDAALGIYTELVEIKPDNLEIRAALAHAYLVKQDYKKAAHEFETIFRGDSLTADDQIRFGQIFVSFIERDSAVTPYAESLFISIRDKFPGDWRPYWFLGALANITDDDSAAIGYFTRVRELAVWNPDGWMGIAGVHYGNQDFSKTIQVLEEAKPHIPEEFRLYFLLGLAHQQSANPAEAATALEKAIRIDPKRVEAYSAIALVYDGLDRTEDADSAYERALRIDPDNHLVLNNYGYSLAERGIQLERALRMAEEAVRQEPENQSYLDTYGWALYSLERYAEAKTQIEKAVTLGSASAVIIEHLGDVYYRLRDIDKAVEHWQRAFELDATNDTLAEKIRRRSL